MYNITVLSRIGNISAGRFSYEMDRIALFKIMLMHQGIVLPIFLQSRIHVLLNILYSTMCTNRSELNANIPAESLSYAPTFLYRKPAYCLLYSYYDLSMYM